MFISFPFSFHCMLNWFSVDLASERRPSDCNDLLRSPPCSPFLLSPCSNQPNIIYLYTKKILSTFKKKKKESNFTSNPIDFCLCCFRFFLLFVLFCFIFLQKTNTFTRRARKRQNEPPHPTRTPQSPRGTASTPETVPRHPSPLPGLLIIVKQI